ncbi:MAG TPA: glutamate--cysteine ligase [Casimicrobiaceae bacterium]|jgi:glutamate--cysteine ligase
MNALDNKLRTLAPALPALLRGIEKESLRVRPDGTLALTPHARGLGSALTHPHVTTDFSESQLELITGVHTTVRSLLAELSELHKFVYREIGDEVMWCASMPCQLPDEPSIPLGRYGTSNVGRAKFVYRTGLSHRYGRRMQLISGLHYNFSLPTESWPLAGIGDANQAYFALIRNFRRHAWLLLYLFGASPAVCASFVEGRPHALAELAPGTLHLPYATSLRMGRLGYLSEAQDALAVSYNDLDSYAASLADALTTPYPAYEKIGIRDGDDYRQLSTALLQIENEFYSTIRPKRVILPGERPLHALRARGVEYVEVRAMDLDPFAPVGIAPTTARFLDVFLLHCLLAESPPDTPHEVQAINRNKQRVASRGREPGLTLDRNGHEVELRSWAREIVTQCAPIASALDDAHRESGYAKALAHAAVGLAEPDSLPSARMLREIREQYRGSYVDFVLAHSVRHRQALAAEPLSPAIEARMIDAARASLEEQRQIEASDAVPFETFRERYLSPDSLVVR